MIHFAYFYCRTSPYPPQGRNCRTMNYHADIQYVFYTSSCFLYIPMSLYIPPSPHYIPLAPLKGGIVER